PRIARPRFLGDGVLALREYGGVIDRIDFGVPDRRALGFLPWLLRAIPPRRPRARAVPRWLRPASRRLLRLTPDGSTSPAHTRHPGRDAPAPGGRVPGKPFHVVPASLGEPPSPAPHSSYRRYTSPRASKISGATHPADQRWT